MVTFQPEGDFRSEDRPSIGHAYRMTPTEMKAPIRVRSSESPSAKPEYHWASQPLRMKAMPPRDRAQLNWPPTWSSWMVTSVSSRRAAPGEGLLPARIEERMPPNTDQFSLIARVSWAETTGPA